MAKQKEDQQTDYSGIASLLKWGVLGIVIIGGGATVGYIFLKKASSDKKEDKEFNNTTAVDKKGNVTTALVGSGKTPSAYSTLLNSAITATSWGIPDTDEETIYKLLKELKTQYEVALVSTSYQALYKKTLSEGLQNDLDNDEFNQAINIITAKPFGGKSK